MSEIPTYPDEVKAELAPPVIEFKDFGKIARFRTIQAVITEKIDGANVQIFVAEDGRVLAGSRNRWITPGKTTDNFGFAAYVEQNAEAFRRLGYGRHFGEWFGASIGRRYGMSDRRLALFDHQRFSGGLPEGLPANVSLVPILYRGHVESSAIMATIEALYAGGSVAVPGWTTPEGVIVQAGAQRWKVTDHGDQHKGVADALAEARS